MSGMSSHDPNHVFLLRLSEQPFGPLNCQRAHEQLSQVLGWLFARPGSGLWCWPLWLPGRGPTGRTGVAAAGAGKAIADRRGFLKRIT